MKCSILGMCVDSCLMLSSVNIKHLVICFMVFDSLWSALVKKKICFITNGWNENPEFLGLCGAVVPLLLHLEGTWRP